ncbi:MAG: hypothetical protein ACYDDF_12445 [Thermoplasmatota archaeon]
MRHCAIIETRLSPELHHRPVNGFLVGGILVIAGLVVTVATITGPATASPVGAAALPHLPLGSAATERATVGGLVALALVAVLIARMHQGP